MDGLELVKQVIKKKDGEKCFVCGKGVKEGLSCGGCGDWAHFPCLGLRKSKYKRGGESGLMCPTCESGVKVDHSGVVNDLVLKGGEKRSCEAMGLCLMLEAQMKDLEVKMKTMEAEWKIEKAEMETRCEDLKKSAVNFKAGWESERRTLQIVVEHLARSESEREKAEMEKDVVFRRLVLMNLRDREVGLGLHVDPTSTGGDETCDKHKELQMGQLQIDVFRPAPAQSTDVVSTDLASTDLVCSQQSASLHQDARKPVTRQSTPLASTDVERRRQSASLQQGARKPRSRMPGSGRLPRVRPVEKTSTPMKALLIGDISGGTGAGFCNKPGYRAHQIPGIGIAELTKEIRKYDTGVPVDLKVVTLCVGTRDLYEKRSRCEILGNVRELLAAVRERFGDTCKVYMTSVLTSRGECPREVNSEVMDVCREFNVWFINLSTIRRGVLTKREWHHRIGSAIRSEIEKKEMESLQGFWKRTVWRKQS